MARATRSSAQLQEKDKHIELTSNLRAKAGSKKRKRVSVGEADDGPAKHSRPALNGDLSHDLAIESDANTQEDNKPTLFPSAGDVPITSDDARKILVILEMIDTQNLLDRVFPLPPNIFTPSTSKDSVHLLPHSLRSLLKEASEHPLSVLRTAVQHLMPISYHPRSRPSTPAAQQLRFCNLALSLLDQASFHSVAIPSDMESLLLPPLTESELDSGTGIEEAASGATISGSVISPSSRKRKYALMQRLPTGDWWTSLNSDFALPPKDLKELPTGHAELVAILPSVPQTENTELPTLGSYAAKRTQGSKPKLPAPRRVSCGSFLDYGPNASFAPYFEQEGREIGRAQLGEVYSSVEAQKRRRALMSTHSRHNVPADDQDSTMAEEDVMEVDSASKVSMEDALDGVLSKSQIAAIKGALDNLELEAGVQELLERNRRALVRLETLQTRRLDAEGGGSSSVEVGSEEWETAQGIVDSLTLLASLRPRSSQHETPPLIPPPAVLHALHRTLLLGPSPGWNGTLPPTQKISLRDDSTLRVRAGVTLPLPGTITAPSTSVAPTTPLAAPTPAHPYPAYIYTPYTAQQYRGGYVPYKPGQATSYYGAYPSSTVGQSSASVQNPATSTSYYSPHFATSGQQSYAYGGWYNYQPTTGTAAPSTSGRGTPQPATAGRNTPTPYTPLSTAQPTPQRAVANTVLTKHYMATSGYAAPTLPSHLRGATTTPATPSPAAGGGFQHGVHQAA